MNKDFEAIIVSHTHWDREWYLPYQKFRAKLIKVMDEVIEVLNRDEKFKSFTLDGQIAILEDYLEIKPERRKEIENLVKKDRLLIGPWYIQMDEFLEGDEAIIRNLLIGIKIASEFGKAMLAGYVPDSFGHISQLPQILQGFNIDSFIFTRGMGDEGEKLKTEFIWYAPDGSKVLAVHLLKGYCNADLEMTHILGKSREEIRKNPKEALALFEWLKSELLPKSSINCILLMNGCDHRSIQSEIPFIIEELNRIFRKDIIKHGSLLDYIKRIKEANIKLESYQGELRGARYHPILSGVFSSRIYLKRENTSSQILLQYYAEPLATFAWILGYEYPYDLLLKAWKYLIQNQAHDSICGTCIDEVHRENCLRFSWIKQIAEYIIKNSIKFIASKIKLENTKTNSAIFVYNPLNWERSEIVEVKISKLTGKYFEIKDINGKSIPFQIIKIEKDKINIIFVAENVPPCGYKIFLITPSEKPPFFQSTLKYNMNEIENEFFKIKANPEEGGSLTIFDKRDSRIYDNVNILEDDGDNGDEYYFSYVPPTFSSNKLKALIKIVEKGPIRATLRIKIDFILPKEIDEKNNRSPEKIKCPIIMDVSLYPKVPRIDIKGKINNKAKDHRLRALFPTIFNIKDVKYSFAHDNFYVVKRPIIPEKGKNWVEPPSTTHPQRFFVCIDNGINGLMIANKGLPEYEIIEREQLYIAITLLRCVGWLSRSEKIGPIIQTPEAQCLGINKFEYSIIPYNKHWFESGAYKEAYNFNIPLIAYEVEVKNGILPLEKSFIKIHPDKLILTTIKKAENEDAIVVRFYNISDEKFLSHINIFPEIKKLYITDLNEKPLMEVKSQNEFKINIDPYKIVTIKGYENF
ncbi:MAG: glycosyl hydrolase-related protein [Nitrososphaerota archaeon]